MHARSLLPFHTALPLLLAAAGCFASSPDDAEAIGAALEMEAGGLTLDDEAAAFGAPEALAAAELMDAPPLFPDEMEADPDVLAISATPDAVRYHVAIQWGQIPGDRENDATRDWSGIFHVSRGAVLVRRTIAFEPATDRILPRPGPRTVAFTSVTLPHHDGVLLTIVDPTPLAPEPLRLGYVADLPGPRGAEAGWTGVAVRDLVRDPHELAADDAGNRMVAIAAARAVDACAHGFLLGRWHRVGEGRGRLIGRVVGADGDLLGHVRGIYGTRESTGEDVFFGKFIDREGRARGIFAGRYAEGDLGGRWRDRSGDRGVIAGRYHESLPGAETGGHFVARWSEHTCPE